MNMVWRSREPVDKVMISTRAYDEDYNLIMSGTSQTGETMKFLLSESSLDEIPCARLERLMMVISSSPHHSLLKLHIHLQGKIL